jgi:RNA-binding protein YhbY
MSEKKTLGSIQLGKQGVTENFISSLKHLFDTHRNVKINVLSSATRDKAELKEFSDEILEKLGPRYTTKILGFKITVKQWRRAVSRD